MGSVWIRSAPAWGAPCSICFGYFIFFAVWHLHIWFLGANSRVETHRIVYDAFLTTFTRKHSGHGALLQWLEEQQRRLAGGRTAGRLTTVGQGNAHCGRRKACGRLARRQAGRIRQIGPG